MDRGFVLVLSAVCCGLSARRAVLGVLGSFFWYLTENFIGLFASQKPPYKPV